MAYALTNAPAHLVIPVKVFGIGVYADPALAPGELPTSLIGDRVTKFSDGKQTKAFLDLVSLLRSLGFVVVTASGT
jgi:hypothetical protein